MVTEALFDQLEVNVGGYFGDFLDMCSRPCGLAMFATLPMLVLVTCCCPFGGHCFRILIWIVFFVELSSPQGSFV